MIALVVLVWGIALAHRISLPIMGIVTLLAGTVFGPFFFAIDGPIAISIDRVLWFAMAGLFVTKWLTGKTCPVRLNRLDWVVVAFAAWLLISSQMGKTPASGTDPTARWLFYVALPVGMYFVPRFSRLSRFELRCISACFVGLGIYLGITAFAEKLGFTAMIFPTFIADPSHVEFFGRARGPLLNPAGNGFLLSIAVCSVMLMFHESSRLGRVCCMLAAALALGGVYATLTRSAWIASAAALAMSQFTHVSRQLRVWVVASSILVAIVIATLFGNQLLNLKRDKHLSATAASESIELRPMLAAIAFEMFKDRPILGFGYGHYFAYNERYALAVGYDMPIRKAAVYNQHNVLLSYLVDTGILGAGLFLLLIVGWSMRSWQIARTTSACSEARRVGLVMMATICCFLINGMFQDVSIIPMVNMYLFYIAGLTIAVHSVDGKLPAQIHHERRVRACSQPAFSQR
ncbi:MAG: O-antigen ligase family protein [Pirellulaceae bacterium]